ncbi:MAG: hypothetical protein M1821_010047 [Bathelium mastoideum]|nr:MAG: hypothetical protein M1821_010047 [Bathelium mastoideum]
MPNTAARTSGRDLGRKSAKQAATRARTRASQEGGSLLHASERRDDGDLDHVVHEVVETTKFRASASPSNAFAPVSHSGPVEHPDENAPPGMAIKEDPHVHQDPAETYHPESASYFPGGPLTWEWDGPEDFAQDYEPQGELLNEAGDRRSLEQQDFSFREVTADSPQIQSYFSNQFRGSTLDHPQLPDQSLQRRPPQPGSDSRQPAFHTTGDKRKSITAIEGEAGGASGDPAPKRVAFSPEETGGAPEQAIANLQAQHHRNGGILRRGSEGPASNATQAPASRPDSTTQQEEPVSKRAKPSSRRDRPGEKKMALPAGKVFPIQIGSELFRLSGASISSDGTIFSPSILIDNGDAKVIQAPSYFSDFFTEQLRSTDDGSAASIKTLYIDRDPITFRDISLHLQGKLFV